MSKSQGKLVDQQGHPAELPAPDARALAHSSVLSELIAETIRNNGGSIGFDEYMQLALYAPGLGYYSAGATKFGADGDFTTAPETSPLFGQCLAGQCAEILETIPDGDIVEFGGGTGALASSLLRALDETSRLPRRYQFVEVSAELRERQAATLRAAVPQLMTRVEWLDDFPPPGFRGVVLGNELLDAMPVKCFELDEQQVLERRVAGDGHGELRWSTAPATAELADAVSAVTTEAHSGYRSEINLQLDAWWRSLGARVAEAIVLLIDYGYPGSEYYHSQRREGTLICHYRQRAHDNPFFYPGLQDISASVDFTAVAQAAEAAGFRLLAYTTQAHFLLAGGIEQCMSAVQDTRRQLELAQQVKRLTLPSEMGERFQVIAMGKGVSHKPSGFDGRDLRHRL